jgi:hypothetical protein
MPLRGSNIEGPAGARVNNGFLPYTKGASSLDGPNQTEPGCRRNGSFPQGESANTIDAPNETPLRPGSSLDRSNPTVVSPGKGSIPVGPAPLGGTATGTIPKGVPTSRGE